MFGPVPILNHAAGVIPRRYLFTKGMSFLAAEYTAIFVQQVAAGQNVAFTETAVPGSNCINHREGSGIITLRGLTNQCFARFKVVFGGNIAIPTGGTVGPISIAIAIEGEALGSATATVTPAAVGDEFNVFAEALVAVPRGCCVSVSVKNINTQAIEVQNGNIIIERIS